MPLENLEIVRRWEEAISTGIDEGLAVVETFWDPDGDYYPVRKFPDSKPRHGHAGLIEFITGFWDAYATADQIVEELIDAGQDCVLVVMNLRAEGRVSGVKLEGRVFQCFWLRHGRFFRAEDHLTERGAIRAFGLEAETIAEAFPSRARS